MRYRIKEKQSYYDGRYYFYPQFKEEGDWFWSYFIDWSLSDCITLKGQVEFRHRQDAVDYISNLIQDD